jgi:galactonate dehydratase
MIAEVTDRITGIVLTNARVSAKTRWLFVQVTTAAGLLGAGEATVQREEAAVLAELAQIAPSMLGQPADPRRCRRWPLMRRTRAFGAAVSALDHALWDIAGQREGKAVARLLGSGARDLELYANVNRGLAARDPGAFAAAARDAAAAGFRAIKIAPFDEVDAHGRWGAVQAATPSAIDAGLSRIAAVRDALGDRDLMIDCHWRFDEAWAGRIIDAVAAFRLYWVECPIPEHEQSIPALRRLRGRANRHGMRLAGGEDGVGLQAFLPMLEGGAYDVLMPDIKYVGGMAEMHAVAGAAAARGAAIAPHNPSGPVAHAASVQVCAGLPGFTRLELQFNESPLFDSLVRPGVPAAKDGRVAVPQRPGLGVALEPHALSLHTVERQAWGEEPAATREPVLR